MVVYDNGGIPVEIHKETKKYLGEMLFGSLRTGSNYDDTEQYPAVLSTKGFYNIVNGTMGIGIGAASSIPQFNLKEVNDALIKLLWNPECDFEEIYCAPDFATGGILLNENEVKESLKNGTGKACKLRSVIEFDPKERCLIVTETPYSVYTNTICGELEAILEGEDNPGIDRFNDLTGSSPLIKIYLTKKANPDKVLRYLYKNTSLQYHYSINMTMLDEGRYPKVFTWKNALLSHIEHEKKVYRRSFEFDLNKIEQRLHIVEGILIALARIEEVIETLKKNPDDRRMIISAWNVEDIPDMALPPCHFCCQFYTKKMTEEERWNYFEAHMLEKDNEEGRYNLSVSRDENYIKGSLVAYLDRMNVPSRKLSCMWHQRSVDVLLGLPFNIMSYAVFTHMIAQCVNMDVDELIFDGGDVHVYENQIETYLSTQKLNHPKLYALPTLKLNQQIKNINDFTYDDIKIEGYQSYSKINYPLNVGL